MGKAKNSALKKGDRVVVWNHTIGGKLVKEGVARLYRKLDSEMPPTEFTDGTDRVVGRFERWMVNFPEDYSMMVERWVRPEDRQ